MQQRITKPPSLQGGPWWGPPGSPGSLSPSPWPGGEGAAHLPSAHIPCWDPHLVATRSVISRLSGRTGGSGQRRREHLVPAPQGRALPPPPNGLCEASSRAWGLLRSRERRAHDRDTDADLEGVIRAAVSSRVAQGEKTRWGLPAQRTRVEGWWCGPESPTPALHVFWVRLLRCHSRRLTQGFTPRRFCIWWPAGVSCAENIASRSGQERGAGSPGSRWPRGPRLRHIAAGRVARPRRRRCREPVGPGPAVRGHLPQSRAGPLTSPHFTLGSQGSALPTERLRRRTAWCGAPTAHCPKTPPRKRSPPPGPSRVRDMTMKAEVRSSCGTRGAGGGPECSPEGPYGDGMPHSHGGEEEPPPEPAEVRRGPLTATEGARPL